MCIQVFRHPSLLLQAGFQWWVIPKACINRWKSKNKTNKVVLWDTLEIKLVSHWENELPSLSGWIINELISAKFFIGSLLSDTGLYKWFYGTAITTRPILL
jgi:hypothetical protein